MRDRNKENTLDGLRRALMFGALAVVGGLMLAGCQPANDMIQRDSLIDDVHRLPPWRTPEASRGTVVQFLPFSGVPVNTADLIYKTVRNQANQEGIQLALRLDEPATYRVRTMVTAVGTTDVATFVFTVEIYDPTGKRVHRFSGQEYGAAPSAGDQWSGMDSDTARHLGERILLGVKVWLTRRIP